MSLNKKFNLEGKHFFLAPMAGITDLPFRLFMRELGAEVVTSELISAEGFSHGSHRTKEMATVHSDEHPAGLQIFGAKPKSMSELAKFCEDQGADFVDINLGCPVPKVVKSGAGSAMLREPKKLAELLNQVRPCLSVPLSIKIRTGWNDEEVNAKEIVRVASECGVDWVSIHGRTREQGYEGLANWDIIKDVCATSPIPIIGNGDIGSAEVALKRIEESGCHGVMMGRAVLNDPTLFHQCLRSSKKEATPLPPIADILKRYVELVMEYTHPKVAHTKLKKMFVYYSGGISGKGPFRQKMFKMHNNHEDILEVALEFLTQEKFDQKKNDNIFFLKGGHG